MMYIVLDTALRRNHVKWKPRVERGHKRDFSRKVEKYVCMYHYLI